MRPSRTVARAALTAVLALGALPGLAGSRTPSQAEPIDAAVFRPVNLATTRTSRASEAPRLDLAGRSAAALEPFDAVPEPDFAAATVAAYAARVQPVLRAPSAGSSWKKPRSTITGFASFYDHGTTAMRDVPRGTTIVICGRGGCIQTVVSDYGPAKSTGRVIDMYRPDFFRICGCGWWSGTTEVTVRVY